MSENAERPGERKTFQSHLLRLWRMRDGKVRRASLESAQTGDRRCFAVLDAPFDNVRSLAFTESSPYSCEKCDRKDEGMDVVSVYRVEQGEDARMFAPQA